MRRGQTELIEEWQIEGRGGVALRVGDLCVSEETCQNPIKIEMRDKDVGDVDLVRGECVGVDADEEGSGGLGVSGEGDPTSM